MTKIYNSKNYNEAFNQSELNLRHLGYADAPHLSAFQDNHHAESCLILRAPSFIQCDTTPTLAGMH